MVGEVPDTGILVGAPHTSNWDFVTMLLVMWHGGAHPRVLVKKQLFTPPLGWILRRPAGCRSIVTTPGPVVRELVAEAGTGEPFRLILAAEGTRGKGEFWKSGSSSVQGDRSPDHAGVLRSADQDDGIRADVPRQSDDVTADMDMVRAFFADKHGIKPKNATEPSLRDEPGPSA